MPLLKRYGVDQSPVSIYFGGGSPGLWDPVAIFFIVLGIKRRLGLPKDAEVTLEFNPEDTRKDLLFSFLLVGVNRLSLGTQSFRDKALSALGRHHDAKMNRFCLDAVLDVGYTDVNVDLIWGMAGETLDGLSYDLRTACSHPAVTHVSTYELSIEENTPFGQRAKQGETLQVDEETRIQMDALIQKELTKHRFNPYEVSNAAKPGYHSVHNALYWEMGHYLGLGAGACGFIHGTSPEEIYCGVRTENPKTPEAYAQFVNDGLKGETLQEIDALSYLKESIMVGLRLKKGFTLPKPWFNLLKPRMMQMVQDGLLVCDEELGLVKTTDQGRLILNQVILRLWDALPEAF